LRFLFFGIILSMSVSREAREPQGRRTVEGEREPTAEEKEFGRRLTEALAEAGYKTQRARCRAVGVSQSAMNRYERGQRRPKPPVLEKIASLTGRDLNWYYGSTAESVASMLADLHEEMLMRIMEGTATGEAFDSVAHDPRWLSPTVRKRLEESEQELRAYVRREAGGAWDDLTAVGKRALIRALARREVSRFLGAEPGEEEPTEPGENGGPAP
jgi:transcriptional regulator with XRE-family HTH domain